MAKSRRRKKLIKRIRWRLAVGIAGFLIFIAAFIYYFANNFMVAEREYAVYSSMDEPALPVIYAVFNGTKINPMHGYMQDMGNAAAGDLITPLNDDRSLNLRIEFSESNIAGISYEIRSLDLEHFIENTTVTDYGADENGDILVTLPIQNLIDQDTPYLLNLKLDIGENDVNYYTRIIWTEKTDLEMMVETASEFTEKSFDYESARELTMYLETDPAADNSSLATVDISSAFSQITWGNTGMKLLSEPIINIREYDGMMGAVEAAYMTETVGSSGSSETYCNTDEYTMRAGTDRIYMMNFQRKTDQVFDGKKYLFAGNRISLGIVNEDGLQTKVSDNTKYIAFKSGRELWLYDQQEKKAVNVFSFRSENDTVRAGYNRHDIKILSIDDNGNLDFAVYGYINRGNHEGWNGIIYYRYDAGSATVRELFFIPRAEVFERIKSELDEMCVKSSAGMFYFKQADAISAIDLTSLEMLNIVSDITGDRYAISSDQTKIAWTETPMQQHNSIKLMDINTGNPLTIQAEDGEILKTMDFYGHDLIYGISSADEAESGGIRQSGHPVHTIKIVDMALNEIMSYEREGLYFDDVTIDGDRIQIAQYTIGDAGTYQFAGRDTIVSTSEEADPDHERISSGNTSDKKKVYYIDLDETIRTTRSLEVTAPENISFEGSGTLEISTAAKQSQSIRYYAYANGRYAGVGYSLNDAVSLIYDDMGWVKDQNSAVVYARADRSSSRVLRDPYNASQPAVMEIENGFDRDVITENGYIIMNASGMEMNRILYYVGKGYPAVAFVEDGRYCLIYGYDSTDIWLYYPSEDLSAGETVEMSLEEAALYFDRYDNAFIVFRDYAGM